MHGYFSGYTGTHEDGMLALSRLDNKKIPGGDVIWIVFKSYLKIALDELSEVLCKNE